jgi:hypothetical protein
MGALQQQQNLLMNEAIGGRFRAPCLAVERAQVLAHRIQFDQTVDGANEMVDGHVPLDVEAVEQFPPVPSAAPPSSDRPAAPPED